MEKGSRQAKPRGCKSTDTYLVLNDGMDRIGEKVGWRWRRGGSRIESKLDQPCFVIRWLQHPRGPCCGTLPQAQKSPGLADADFMLMQMIVKTPAEKKTSAIGPEPRPKRSRDRRYPAKRKARFLRWAPLPMCFRESRPSVAGGGTGNQTLSGQKEGICQLQRVNNISRRQAFQGHRSTEPE